MEIKKLLTYLLNEIPMPLPDADTMP